MGDTTIEWTDETWNPVTGHEDRIDTPIRWRKPRKVFVNSMSDLFHEAVPDTFIDRVFAVMALAPRHTFQVLTKRPERMRDYLTQSARHDGTTFEREEWIRVALSTYHAPRGKYAARIPWPLPNVWLGVSVEDQRAADERIPMLLQTPAAVRFLSCEPLLGPIEFSDVTRRIDAVGLLGKKALDGIGWIIVGGESGPGARTCDIAWIRSIVAQCRAAGVPAFVKQLGRRRSVRLTRGRQDQHGRRLCCWCGTPVPKGRRDWCGDTCVARYQIERGDQGAARRWLWRRDLGVCRLCGTDTVAPHELVFGDRRVAKTDLGASAGQWEADHQVPICEGGAMAPYNLRTLCVPCHRAETRALRARRKNKTNSTGQPPATNRENQ